MKLLIKRLVKNYPVVVPSVLTGFAFGAAFSRLPIPFERKVNVVDFATLLVTIIVGYVFASIIEPEREVHRNEKQLLLEHANELQNDLKALFLRIVSHYSDFRLSQAHKQEITREFRRCSNLLQSFMDINAFVKNTDADKNINLVKQEYFNFKKVVTGQFSKSDFSFIKVSHTEIEKSFFSLKMEIAKTIIQVNRR